MAGSINILNIGTRILLRDTMDQYVRTLGDYKTHYASSMQNALKSLSSSPTQIIISEVEYTDGSAFRLLREMNWSPETSDVYVILAIEESKKEIIALAEEMEVHSVLAKPFAAADLKLQIERFQAWKELPKQPWQLLIREAMLAYKEKRFRDAEQNLFEAVKSAPDNPVPAFKTAIFYLQKNDYPIAEKLLKKALELKPSFIQAISAMGSLYMKKKEYEKAEECFRKAQSVSPMNPDRLLEMVNLQMDWSMELCKSALRLDPGAIAARYTLGKLYAVEKDYIGTVREVEAVLPFLKPEQKTEAQTFVALARKLGSLAK